MGAGKHDKRVEIQSATESRDDHGTVTRSWTTDATRWARISDQSGREIFDADQVRAHVNVLIELRENYSGLSPHNRMKFGSRVFNIEQILRPQRVQYGRGQQCVCTEVL